MCASPLRGAAVAEATAGEPCVCRRFASDFFFRSFPFVPFVIAGLDPAIHTAVRQAKRLPPSACLLEVSMDHRIKSGGDDR
jgi:hypothetical protein